MCGALPVNSFTNNRFVTLSLGAQRHHSFGMNGAAWSKVNHFGKTDMSNLYKNQQITNHLDPILCLLTRSVAVGSQPAVQTAGLFSRPKQSGETKKPRPWPAVF